MGKKTVQKETISDLTTAEFNQVVETFVDREDDRIEPSAFLKAIAELEHNHPVKSVELTGQVVNGTVIFDTPAPLPVVNNTFYIGDTKVTLKLQMDNSD